MQIISKFTGPTVDARMAAFKPIVGTE